MTEDLESQQAELLKLAQYEAEELEQEMADASQLDMPNAYEDLKPKHFPLFVTVKQLLYMMDASLQHSFFKRDAKNNIIGMDANLSWHNENKGMFMINTQHKAESDYDALLAKYSQDLIEELDQEGIASEQVEEEDKTRAE